MYKDHTELVLVLLLIAGVYQFISVIPAIVRLMGGAPC